MTEKKTLPKAVIPVPVPGGGSFCCAVCNRSLGEVSGLLFLAFELLLRTV